MLYSGCFFLSIFHHLHCIVWEVVCQREFYSYLPSDYFLSFLNFLSSGHFHLCFDIMNTSVTSLMHLFFLGEGEVCVMCRCVCKVVQGGGGNVSLILLLEVCFVAEVENIQLYFYCSDILGTVLSACVYLECESGLLRYTYDIHACTRYTHIVWHMRTYLCIYMCLKHPSKVGCCSC